MSRIEKELPVAEEPERKETRSRGKRSCALVLLVAVLLGAFWAAWAVASTGLVSVPVLTGLAYHKPEPSVSVEPGVPFEAFLSARLLEPGKNPDDSFSLSIPESTLTASVRDALSSSGQTIFDDRKAQASVTAARGVELYLPLQGNARETAAVVRLRVSAKDGALVVSVEDASVGSWAVWGVIQSAILEPAVSAGLERANQSVADAGVSLTDVSEQDGFLTVHAAR